MRNTKSSKKLYKSKEIILISFKIIIIFGSGSNMHYDMLELSSVKCVVPYRIIVAEFAVI